MTTLTHKIEVERRLREQLREAGLPEPDEIEYGHQCVRLFWRETGVIMVVDLDAPDENGDGRG